MSLGGLLKLPWLNLMLSLICQLIFWELGRSRALSLQVASMAWPLSRLVQISELIDSLVGCLCVSQDETRA